MTNETSDASSAPRHLRRGHSPNTEHDATERRITELHVKVALKRLAQNNPTQRQTTTAATDPVWPGHFLDCSWQWP